MTCWQILKIGITKGYILIGICVLCFILHTVVWIVYGTPDTISTDPEYPLGKRGITRYMPQESYERYDFWRGLFAKIGFISGLTGTILCIWAHRSTNS